MSARWGDDDAGRVSLRAGAAVGCPDYCLCRRPLRAGWGARLVGALFGWGGATVALALLSTGALVALVVFGSREGVMR